MKKKAVVVGYSGHAYVVLDLLLSNNYVIKGYCEKVINRMNPFKISYLGFEGDKEVLSSIKADEIFIGLGDNGLRKTIAEYLFHKGCSLPNLIHPSAIISKKASMKDANTIMPGVVINSLVRLGKGNIFNTSSIIEHECAIGDFVHLAPGVVLAGSVNIGDNSFVGANSVVRQGIQIGNNVIIGAGSVVTRNVPDNSILYGNPARIRS